MGIEIERKFLVRGEPWRGAPATLVRQGYLSSGSDRSLRVRVADGRAVLGIKGGRGITRLEFEYEIPLEDANLLLDRLAIVPVIEKTRYLVEVEGFTWEIDVFHGPNDGLVVAEIELDAEDQPFARPPWLAEEVTHDPRYLNVNLVASPYRTWK